MHWLVYMFLCANTLFKSYCAWHLRTIPRGRGTLHRYIFVVIVVLKYLSNVKSQISWPG